MEDTDVYDHNSQDDNIIKLVAFFWNVMIIEYVSKIMSLSMIKIIINKKIFTGDPSNPNNAKCLICLTGDTVVLEINTSAFYFESGLQFQLLFFLF